MRKVFGKHKALHGCHWLAMGRQVLEKMNVGQHLSKFWFVKTHLICPFSLTLNRFFPLVTIICMVHCIIILFYCYQKFVLLFNRFLL